VYELTGVITRDIILCFPLAAAVSLATGLAAGWDNAMRVIMYGLVAWVLAFLVLSNIPGLHDENRAEPKRVKDPEDEDD
jgi:hypothetical protein